VNLKNFFIKNYFSIFLFFFFVIGVYLSLNVSITHDEIYDLYVWNSNKIYVKDLLTGSLSEQNSLEGMTKFYGIGFHILSSPLEYIFINFLQNDQFNYQTKIYLSKHVTVFLFFLVSGVFFKKILNIIIKNNFNANLGTVVYLLYPYLLGHSFFNTKDIPFLSVWIICTYLIIKIVKNLLEKKKFFNRHIYFISILTAYLISIRISGILIFIQYLIFILFACNQLNIKFLTFIKQNVKYLVISLILISFFIILLTPVYWLNPLLFFKGILFMSNHTQTVCTTTLGECMKAQNLPSTYIPIWLLFKLPITILVGFILFPFVEKKLFSNSLNYIILSSLAFTSLIIVIFLILFNVNLYDEIRHIMFLIPSLFIISLVIFFNFSKKIYKFLFCLTFIFFIFQNIKIYPYNYVWLNNFTHLTKVNGVFELDYWGVSTRKISNFINNNINSEHCIVSNREKTIKSFLNKNHCLLSFKKLHKQNKRPFYVVLLERALNKGVPNGCDLIHQEEVKINFSNEKIVLAKIFKCD